MVSGDAPAPITFRSSNLNFIATTVKTVMSCEPKRASPYSVDVRWYMVL